MRPVREEIGQRLIESLTPMGRDMVALVELYADESESAGCLTVAAYVFTRESAIAMNAPWAAVLNEKRLPYFRMSDCAHGNGVFAAIEKPDRINIQKRIFSILKDHIGCGFSVSFDLGHRDMLPSSLNIKIDKVTPYSFCCYWLLLNARRWTAENYPEAKIAYFFEAGDPGQSQANNIMNTLYSDAWHRNHFKMVSHAFVDKEYSAAIQSGDILAWQWSKNIKDRSEGIMETRADLMSLLEKQHFTTHFDKARIEEFLELIRTSGPQ